MLLLRAQPVSNASELKAALQSAISLEHSTIPPYLTAYYTLKGNSPSVTYARTVIRNVIVEEMLHMTLAANILNAIGGTPKFADPDFIPKYPGPLPMGIGENDGPAPGTPLIVELKRYSRETVKTVFMAIEEPEKPFDIPNISAFGLGAGPRQSFQTIGQFYASIKEQIRQEGDVLFKNADPDRQVRGWFKPNEEPEIKDVASALSAIDIIVEQGEGTPKRPLDFQDDFPHFYRFQELYLGKRLVRDPSSELGVAYDPLQPITIDDRADVIQMVDNPGELDLTAPANLFVRRLSNECDRVYTKLLRALETAFNGTPKKMSDALSTMFELKTVAEELLEQPLPGGGFAGPRFRYMLD